MKLGVNMNGPSSLRLSFLTELQDDKLLELSSLATWPSERGKGHATVLMRQVCDQADEDKTLLLLSPKAFSEGGPDSKKLESWYASFGFVRIQDKPEVLMVRDPVVSKVLEVADGNDQAEAA